MNISEMSDSQKRERIKELKKLIEKTQQARNYAKAMQLGLKLVLNGTYGAFCHPAFTVSNADIASAITASSREVINWMLDHIEDLFYNHWGRNNNLDISNLGIMYISKFENKYYIHRKDGVLIDKFGREDDNDSSGLDKIIETYHLDFDDLKKSDIKKFDNYEVLYKVFIHDFSNIRPIPNTFEVEPKPELTKDSSTHLYRGIRDVPLIIYGDTDSVSASSSIIYENGKSTIEELYNTCQINGTAGITLNGHESVKCHEKVLNYSKNKGLYYASVKRIIRHKVTKAKWRLKTKTGKEITVTNDHSMIVFRNDKQLEIKPKDILKTDKILITKKMKNNILNNIDKIEYIFDDVELIECVGEFKNEYVYDIEIDDETHTFIANDILVHNSLYISYQPIMNSVNFNGDELKFILHMNAVFTQPKFNEFLTEYANKYGVKSLHDFELETINKSALHIQKKHYINNVVWEDGVFYEDLSHFYPKGVEIVKSSTPKFVRDNIWDFIKYLFKNPGNVSIKEVLKIMKNLKKEFKLADIEDISMTTNLANYETKVIEDQTRMEVVKGAHFSVKASVLHNYLLNGGRIKWYFAKTDYNIIQEDKETNADRFAYLRSFHPFEITTKEGVEIDYDLQFEKTFLSIANRFLEPIGLPEINKRLSVLNSLFSSKKKKKKNEIEYDENDKNEIISSDDIDYDDSGNIINNDIDYNNEPTVISSKKNISSENDITDDIEDIDYDDFWD